MSVHFQVILMYISINECECLSMLWLNIHNVTFCRASSLPQTWKILIKCINTKTKSCFASFFLAEQIHRLDNFLFVILYICFINLWKSVPLPVVWYGVYFMYKKNKSTIHNINTCMSFKTVRFALPSQYQQSIVVFQRV